MSLYHRTALGYVRKIIDGASYMLRSADPTATPCCCDETTPVQMYKVRRCATGDWAGWCTPNPPPYYFHKTGQGCFFSGEEVDSAECAADPGGEEFEIDSCADCDEINFPDDPDLPVDPDVSCPCVAEVGCDVSDYEPCVGTGGIARQWRVYVDGVTMKSCDANGLGSYNTGEGTVNGVYNVSCGSEPAVGATAVIYSDAGCTSEIDRDNTTTLGMLSTVLTIMTASSYIFFSGTPQGAFRCCRPNVFVASDQADFFASGGSAVAIPCE